MQAVQHYGAARGTVLACWRLLRCNPFSHGGYDPVERQGLFRPRSDSPMPDDDPERAAELVSCPGRHV